MDAAAFGLTFHHLGLAVPQPEEAQLFLAGLGYRPGKPVFDPLQNVTLMMCDHASMPSIEIICPVGDYGPLTRLLRAHRDGIVYHMCFSSRDVTRSIDALEAADLRAVASLSPNLQSCSVADWHHSINWWASV